MKKFQFSLDHVRDYRDRLLDEETGKLQRLQAERDRLEQQINQLKTDFAQVSEEMRKAQAEGITALEQRGFSIQLESIRMQVRELTEQLEAAKARVEQQTRVVVAPTRRSPSWISSGTASMRTGRPVCGKPRRSGSRNWFPRAISARPPADPEPAGIPLERR